MHQEEKAFHSFSYLQSIADHSSSIWDSYAGLLRKVMYIMVRSQHDPGCIALSDVSIAMVLRARRERNLR
jgi:hypothetical protein